MELVGLQSKKKNITFLINRLIISGQKLKNGYGIADTKLRIQKFSEQLFKTRRSTAMKNWLVTLGLLGATIIPAQAALQLNFAADPNATISFDGAGNFSFPNSGAADFSITSVLNGTNSAVGLIGNLTGTFAIGTISGGAVQTAPVTGAGTLTIFDGVNTFSANTDWLSIQTSGATGSLNTSAALNLSGLTYTGANADLVALKNALSGIGVITFQFGQTTDLTSLKSTPAATSYSGTITAAPVPEPTSIFLFGSMLLGCGIWLRRRGIKIG